MSADLQAQERDVLRAGKAPVGTGASPLVAQLIGLVLVCLGVVGVQALLVALGVVDGPSWLVTGTRDLDGVDGRDPWVLVAGIAAVVVGVLLLRVALKRRPRKGVPLRAETGVYLRRHDVVRLADSALDGADAVVATHVRAQRRTVRVRLTTLAHKDQDEAIVASARTRVTPVLDALSASPRLKIHVDHEGS